ncbi:MAG: helix-turn-helix domain-containing protein [Bacteroidales bacterium]
MKATSLSHIDCNSLRIATSVETSDCSEHSVYYPSHVLLYVQQGQFHFRFNKQLITIAEDNFCLIRKHTSFSCFKTWNEDDDGFKMIAFVLNDEFIEKVSLRLPAVPQKNTMVCKPFFQIPPNPILLGLMSSLDVYLREKKNINPEIVELKTLESLIGISQNNASILNYLRGFSQPLKADLPIFMEHYYTENISLNELAKLSGRSIATFHREFKSIFNTSPHKWIKEHRLQRAKELLLHTASKPSDIYMDLGFEDFAHFSRSFKQYFGKNPSEVSSPAF